MNGENVAIGTGLYPSTKNFEISVLIPTLNENENISQLIEQLNESLRDFGRSWELLFIDDSDDETTSTIRDLQETNPHISLLHRSPGERHGGLGGAVATGILAAKGRVVVIMDGDLQHPPQMVRELCTAILSGKYDIAIASRYVPGASSMGLDGVKRRAVSRASVALAHILVPKTRGVRDPMSGFFAVSLKSIAEVKLQPHGFKILMEILARSDASRIAEIPYQMNPRENGHSKANAKESIRFVRHVGRLLRTRWSSSTVRKKIFLSLPLLAILAVQFALSYRLIFRNAAYVDEGTYLSAGHYELHVLIHGGPNLYFPTYFSGAPTIYPILAALAADVGGLHAARFLSLGFMLVATILCYDVARRFWGRPAGWIAAGLFVTTQGTQFLGAFATFDAMSLMLTALAAWLVVRFARSAKTSALIYLAAPVMLFANATKYASGIFDPIIFLLAFFTILHFHDLRSAFRTTAGLMAAFGIMLFALLAIAPNTYLAGISSTTTNRATSNYPISQILHDSWIWIGAIFCAAAIAGILSLISAWFGKSDWAMAGVVTTLAIAVALAPANQARIHTTFSLNKHVTYGAWFGAIAVGWLAHSFSRLPWGKLWGTVAIASVSVFAVVALSSLLVVGTRQALQLDNGWPNSSKLINALRPLVTHLNRPILMDEAPIATFYLEDDLPVQYWDNTWYFSYAPTGRTKKLSGLPAYEKAVSTGYFSVIALDFSQNVQVDDAVVGAIQASNRYSWMGEYTAYDAYGRDTYTIWRLNAPAK